MFLAKTLGVMSVVAVALAGATHHEKVARWAGAGVERTTPEKRFEELLRAAERKRNIPVEITQVTHGKEKAPWCKDMACVKFEEKHIKKYAAKITKNPDHQKMWAASICPMQVMAWHLKLDGKDYGEFSELFKEEVCVEQYARVMGDCLDKALAQHKDKWDAYWHAFKCYNGGDDYADDAMARLAVIAVEKL